MVAFDNYLIGQSCLFEWVHCLQREYSADSNWNLAEGAFRLHQKILKLDHQTFPILLYRLDHQPVVYTIENDKSKIFFLSIDFDIISRTCHKQIVHGIYVHKTWTPCLTYTNNTIQMCVVLEPHIEKKKYISRKLLSKKIHKFFILKRIHCNENYHNL